MLSHSDTVLHNSKSKVHMFAEIGTLTTEKVAAGIDINKCLYVSTDTWASAMYPARVCMQTSLCTSS